MGGQILAEFKVHLNSHDRLQHKFRCVHSQLGLQHICDEVDVLLACDDDVVYISTGVHLGNNCEDEVVGENKVLPL